MSLYTEKGKYIFVSYANEDKEQALPIAENMNLAGFCVYCHESEAESSFSIDEKLANSGAVLACVSPNSIDSVKARREINYVLDNQKELLVIYLRDINSKYGLGKELNPLPSLYRSHYVSEISLMNEILKAPILQKYKMIGANIGISNNFLSKNKRKKACKVGNTVKFGSYQQNGAVKEAIEWQVLDVKDEKALLITKYALDCKKYHETTEDITWENCSLRKWLNGEFLNEVFSESEKAMIPTVMISADKNPLYDTNPGNVTCDQLFLLSISEAKKYFKNDNAQMCKPTKFAISNGAYSDETHGNGRWWLRSPGKYPNNDAYIDSFGSVFSYGANIESGLISVRPVLWVDLNIFENDFEDGTVKVPPTSIQNTSTPPTNKNISSKSVNTPPTSAPIPKQNTNTPPKNVSGTSKNTSQSSTKATTSTNSTGIQTLYKIGDAVKFGTYWQNGTDKEPIEWQILEIKDEKALLLSKFGLDSQRYHSKKRDITWEECTLRKWLNEDFLNAAFSDKEKQMIPTVTVSADKNPSHPTNPGKVTQDKIFLLSISETKKYFASDNERKCRFTEFAKKNGGKRSSPNSDCDWLLRSPGYAQNTSAHVTLSGYVTDMGNFVSVFPYAVRPAMWVDLKSLGQKPLSSQIPAAHAVPAKSATFLIEQKRLQKQCKVGNTVKFGTYQQNGVNREAIDWEVLDVKDGKALVISKYGLDEKPYNTIRTNVTWETCSLRKWLNEDFLNNAFSELQKQMIPTVTVSADKNPSYSTNPGNATQDKIFLLSIPEATKYFSSSDARKCKLTAFAKRNGALSSSDGNCCWWLRSPADDQRSATYVYNDGNIRKGGVVGNLVDNDYHAVRPAMWIDLNA